MTAARRRVEVWVARGAWAEAFGCALAVPLIVLVAAVVTLGMGDRAPREVQGLGPALLALSALAGALPFGVYRRTRRRLVGEQGPQGRARLVVEDLAAPLSLEGPLTLEYGFQHQVVKPGAPTMRMLSLRVRDPGGQAVLLQETWGAAHGDPPGWPLGPLPTHPEDDPPAQYTVLTGRHLTELIEVLGGGPEGAAR